MLFRTRARIEYLSAGDTNRSSADDLHALRTAFSVISPSLRHQGLPGQLPETLRFGMDASFKGNHLNAYVRRSGFRRRW